MREILRFHLNFQFVVPKDYYYGIFHRADLYARQSGEKHFHLEPTARQILDFIYGFANISDIEITEQNASIVLKITKIVDFSYSEECWK